MSNREVVVRAADQVPRRDIIEAMNAAYSDYFIPIYLSSHSFENLITREAIHLEASAVALYDNQTVGVGLLGIRGCRAWIGGMGVLPEFRHQGLGRRIMAYLLEQARRMGIKNVQLEVITQNKVAFNLYNSMGFKTTRKLLVLSGEEHLSRPVLRERYPGIVVKALDVSLLLAYLPEFAAVPAPWQRTLESLWQMQDRLDGLSVYGGDEQMLGLCLWSGDNHQVGIYFLNATTQEAAGALLDRLLVALPRSRFFYLNVPEDDPALPVLRSAGFEETVSQYEMHRNLADGM
ncbi:MAG: GNAT family N-acetyltransferase [Anaerolineae bacterium]|nr:GNAT family N-acetyltransferase [Anaerolineae bacterium]